MKKYAFVIVVRPKNGIRDPQSDAMNEVLSTYTQDVSIDYVGRAIKLEVEAISHKNAMNIIHELMERYLVNPNIETFEIVEGEQ